MKRLTARGAFCVCLHLVAACCAIFLIFAAGLWHKFGTAGRLFSQKSIQQR
jgi:hypothetical protein